MVNLSELKVSSILLPEFPIHRVLVVEVSPFAERTTTTTDVCSALSKR